MTELEEMPFLQGKTPISYLQELCTKRGVTPQYDLVANEGAVHEPLFVFKVVAGDCIGTGKGPSKKKAKHNAAVSVLNQMIGVPATSASETRPANDAVKLDPADNLAGNPVGDLQETTQKRMWPPPVYDYTSEQGPPHAREFICTVRLFNFAEQAVGKSKKLAKRNAATAMLQRIRQGLLAPKDEPRHVEDFDEETIPLPQHDVHTFSRQSDTTAVARQNMEPVERKKISAMFQPGKTKLGKVLDSLQGLSLEDDNYSYDDCCSKLAELAKEQKFEVVFVDMSEPSSTGLYQCLVQLSTNPVTVCHGSGTSVEEMHSIAARNALKYLKIMTKKP